MKIHTRRYRVAPGDSVDLAALPTATDPLCGTPAAYRALLADHIAALRDLQELLYAANRYAALLIVQGMDASGKDSMIKHVMSGVNPQGCQVVSFKQPSAHELQHDFLWRAERALPGRGQIGIFNRSYYEDVLIVRVHPDMLAHEGVADHARLWRNRYRSINALERHLDRNGTRIIKVFLHMSRDEQRKRFLKRIDTPAKNWKFSMADIAERAFWDQYQEAYADCLTATSTRRAPWYIVPADDKNSARLIVSQIVVETLRDLKLAFPTPDDTRLAELVEIRKNLV